MRIEDVLGLFDAFADRGISAWAAGGWAVDALVGRQTRPHDDLDLAVNADDLESLLGLLTDQGFVVTVDWAPSRLELTAPDGRTVDVHPVAFAPDGSGIQQGLENRPFHYAADGFTTGHLDGVAIPCLSAEQQLCFRTGYELRLVDHHDIALLQPLLGQP